MGATHAARTQAYATPPSPARSPDRPAAACRERSSVTQYSLRRSIPAYSEATWSP